VCVRGVLCGEVCWNCQSLPLGELSSGSAPSVLVGELFKKLCLFLNTRKFKENAIKELRAITENAFQEAFQQ
jgi:hypothetical protein